MVTQKLMLVYKLWQGYQQCIPKQYRYSLASKTEQALIECVENVVTATFLSKEQKLPYVTRAIVKLDVHKFLLMTLWEMHGLDTKKYTAISGPLNEVGKMLGGWRNQLIKQTSPPTKVEKK